jgi:hypothetical protein
MTDAHIGGQKRGVGAEAELVSSGLSFHDFGNRAKLDGTLLLSVRLMLCF